MEKEKLEKSIEQIVFHVCFKIVPEVQLPFFIGRIDSLAFLFNISSVEYSLSNCSFTRPRSLKFDKYRTLLNYLREFYILPFIHFQYV